VQEHGSCRFGDVADGSFCYAILEVGVDSAVSDGLILLAAVLFECVVSEASVVGVIMPDANAVVSGESFECLFRLYCFL
jgi:hypothetical protein